MKKCSIEKLIGLTVSNIKDIKGFDTIKAEKIVNGLKCYGEELAHLLDRVGFTLELTKNLDDIESPIKGEVVVFTGSFQMGGRGDFEKKAEQLGAQVRKSVTSKTTMLITGANVGATKINAAKERGTRCLTEVQYLKFLGEI